MMIVLVLILLVLVFGAGWLRGILRNIAVFAAATVALILISKATGIDSGSIIKWGFLGFLGLCLVVGYPMVKYENGRKKMIAERRRELRKNRYEEEVNGMLE